jgi:toxin FitB
MMFVLDTNVVSELRKVRTGKADKSLAAWSSTVDAPTLFVSAITIMELETGVLQIERRDTAQGALLRAWLDGHVLPEFAGRVLPVDTAVAQRCARLHVPDRAWHDRRDAQCRRFCRNRRCYRESVGLSKRTLPLERGSGPGPSTDRAFISR